jgi:hypothetical protein
VKHSDAWGVWAKSLVVAAMALTSVGCAIHTQGPIKEVAYDFSDRDFYDRTYAPSPQYLQANSDLGLPVAAAPAPASAEMATVAEPPPDAAVEWIEIPADLR